MEWENVSRRILFAIQVTVKATVFLAIKDMKLVGSIVFVAQIMLLLLIARPTALLEFALHVMQDSI